MALRFLILISILGLPVASETLRALDHEALPLPAFSLCASCHTTAAEGQYRIAPSLKGIIGRKIASVPNFPYSDSLKAQTGVWTKDRLDQFLQRPNHALPGTKMYFRGIRNSALRAELINWLATADVPDVIKPHSDRRPTKDIPRTQKAQDIFRHCKVCHSYTKGAPAKIGPNLWGVVGRPVASFPGFEYSQRLKRRGGTWTKESLNVFFTEKKPFDQGSHQAFKALTHKEDRDALIDYLKSLSLQD